MLANHPDPTVDHVLKTWAPRMIVQGIDYNDLMTTGERIRTWDDWCREWCVTGAGHEEFARMNLAAGEPRLNKQVRVDRRRRLQRRPR